MDQELKQYLEAMEGRLVGQIRESIRESEARTVTLITDVKESLEREIRGVRVELHDLSGRFDIQSIRLDRQAALIQIGSRWTTRMHKRSDRIDAEMEKKHQEIAELRRRLNHDQN